VAVNLAGASRAVWMAPVAQLVEQVSPVVQTVAAANRVGPAQIQRAALPAVPVRAAALLVARWAARLGLAVRNRP
jgi:hypothetical protein